MLLPPLGYFFYVVSRDVPGKRAGLFTPVLEIKQPGVSCFTFYYRMHSIGDIGNLTVYRYERTGIKTPLWSKSGQQGESFRKASMEIPVGRCLYLIVLKLVTFIIISLLHNTFNKCTIILYK